MLNETKFKEQRFKEQRFKEQRFKEPKFKEKKDILKLRKKLYNNTPEREEYLNNELSSSSSEYSDSDTDNVLQVSLPKKHKKGGGSNYLLLQELILQQKKYLKCQKSKMELRNQLDNQELRMRYLKLDLNNANVNTDEYKEKFKLADKEVDKLFKLVLILALFCILFTSAGVYEIINLLH